MSEVMKYQWTLGFRTVCSDQRNLAHMPRATCQTRRRQRPDGPVSPDPNHNRSGAAVVEIAVVAPLLLLLVLGTIEYGRLVMVQQMLTNAAREGARRASVEGVTAAEVVQVVSDYCTDAGITGVSTTVTPDPAAAVPGTPITVNTQIPFDQVSWFPAPVYLTGTTVTASATMRGSLGQ